MKKTKNTISIEEARNLKDNWGSTRGQDIENGRGFEDTREFMVSVSELMDYLNYVKANSSDLNSGIRIYLGAYDNQESNKTTVFLAPTKGVHLGAENDYGIEPLNKTTSGWPPKNY